MRSKPVCLALMSSVAATAEGRSSSPQPLNLLKAPTYGIGIGQYYTHCHTCQGVVFAGRDERNPLQLLDYGHRQRAPARTGMRTSAILHTGVRSESGVTSLSVRCGAGRWLRRHIRLALRPAGVGATALCEATKGTSTESRCALVAIDTQGAGPLAIWHGASPAV